MQPETLEREKRAARLDHWKVEPLAPPLRMREPRRPAPLRARHTRTAIVWGSLGFLTGALFWHAMGFWTFVSNVVWNANAPRGGGTTIARAIAATIDEAAQGAGTVRLDPGTCTSVALDRLTNSIVVHPCPSNELVLRLDSQGHREDLAEIEEAQAKFPAANPIE